VAALAGPVPRWWVPWALLEPLLQPQPRGLQPWRVPGCLCAFAPRAVPGRGAQPPPLTPFRFPARWVIMERAGGRGGGKRLPPLRRGRRSGGEAPGAAFPGTSARCAPALGSRPLAPGQGFAGRRPGAPLAQLQRGSSGNVNSVGQGLLRPLAGAGVPRGTPRQLRDAAAPWPGPAAGTRCCQRGRPGVGLPAAVEQRCPRKGLFRGSSFPTRAPRGGEHPGSATSPRGAFGPLRPSAEPGPSTSRGRAAAAWARCGEGVTPVSLSLPPRRLGPPPGSAGLGVQPRPPPPPGLCGSPCGCGAVQPAQGSAAARPALCRAVLPSQSPHRDPRCPTPAGGLSPTPPTGSR